MRFLGFLLATAHFWQKLFLSKMNALKLAQFVSVLFFMALWGIPTLLAQNVLKGRVVDGVNGDPMFSANVVLVGSTQGVTTDFDGLFRLDVPAPPFEIQVSFMGYASETREINSLGERLTIQLEANQVMIGAAEVVADRISEKQKQAPLTVESMDVLAIKEAPSGNFYEGLGNLKGVDLTSASLGFKIINTRGFNSTSPVRSLQLIGRSGQPKSRPELLTRKFPWGE